MAIFFLVEFNEFLTKQYKNQTYTNSAGLDRQVFSRKVKPISRNFNISLQVSTVHMNQSYYSYPPFVEV